MEKFKKFIKTAGINTWKIIWAPLLFFVMQNFIFLVYAVFAMIPEILKIVFEILLSGGEAAAVPEEELAETLLESLNLHIPVIVSACMTLAAVFLILRREWVAEAFWSLKKVRAAPILMCVLLGVALNFFIGGVFDLLPIPEQEQPFEILLGDNLVLMLFSMALISPLLEEVIFRGIVQKRLTKMMNIHAAIILQAAIFGFIHLNWLQGSYSFILGLVIGAAYLWHGSIWIPAAIHAAFNGTAVVLSRYAGEAEINGSVFIIITAAASAVSALCIIELFKRREM